MDKSSPSPSQSINQPAPTQKKRPADMTLAEPPHTMQIAQILISLLHAWGLDPDLDRVCESKLGLLRPMLPTRLGAAAAGAPEDPRLLTTDLPPELLRQEKLTRPSTRSTASWAGDEERAEQLAAQQTHIKQGWSLLATLHCALLPDKVVAAGKWSPPASE
ncbi:hypothetical protein MSG28_015136 [Choristoneura fumiferana]|uniref:Uncharacterized protein n=1 Tax=Choristoneura fumiferana TaxID=7141 RepID=A0ACC0KYA0_CHOFU|nr:hypothetical protein MSG28_015136 [Choristoneura fumiferana]